MFMRFRGGGVGHKPTREATDQFLKDRHPTDEELASVDEELPANEEVYEDELDYASAPEASDEEPPQPPDGENDALDSGLEDGESNGDGEEEEELDIDDGPAFDDDWYRIDVATEYILLNLLFVEISMSKIYGINCNIVHATLNTVLKYIYHNVGACKASPARYHLAKCCQQGTALQAVTSGHPASDVL
jgi:hypothetical protein